MNREPVVGRSVLVTGANGFLGTHLCKHFAARGWDVIRAARNAQEGGDTNSRTYDLRAGVSENFFSGVDTLVHAAYVQNRDDRESFDRNVAGTATLFAAAARAGIERRLFVSSLSARADAVSSYGRQKYAIEQSLDASRDIIVRPGLILGNGGLFGRMREHLARGRPVPIVDGGRQPLQTVAVGDLTVALESLAAGGKAGTYVLAERPAVAYRRFFEVLCERLGTPARFVDIPGWLLTAALAGSRVAHLRLPIDQDNLIGLRTMRFVDPSDYSDISGFCVRSFRESIDELIGSSP